MLIRRGQIELLMEEKTPQIVEENSVVKKRFSDNTSFPDEAVKDSRVYKISDSGCFEISIVRWKLLERSSNAVAFWLEA